MRHPFVWSALIAFLCVGALAESADQDRPNILFIMSDDHTTQAFGSYGSRLAGLNPTPFFHSVESSSSPHIAVAFFLSTSFELFKIEICHGAWRVLRKLQLGS